MEREQEFLAKIDIIRSRLPVSYRQAAEALTANGGDVIQALADLEEQVVNAGPMYTLNQPQFNERLNRETQSGAIRPGNGEQKETGRQGANYSTGYRYGNTADDGNDWFSLGRSRGSEILAQLKEIVARGRETKIKIKQGERTVAEIPVAAGLIGLLAALASSELAILGALGSITAMAKKYTIEIERPGEGERATESEQRWTEQQIPQSKGYTTGGSQVGDRDDGQRTPGYGGGKTPYDAL